MKDNTGNKVSKWQARIWKKEELYYSNRIKEAIKILGKWSKFVKVRGYTCDIEQCGHSDSIILQNNNFQYRICYSLNELKEVVLSIRGIPKSLAIKKLLGV